MVADLALVNGSVFRADAARTFCEAVAVAGGRIVGAGGAGELADLIGAQTRVVDLAGRMVVPGFQDAHVHPALGGLRLLRCDLHDAGDQAAALAAIAGYAASHPEERWIRGGGWRYDWFAEGNPPAALLDAVVPDRPVTLTVADGHSYWANSAALTRASITAGTPEPRDGQIVRLPDGSPQGTLHEGAMKLIDRVAPLDGIEELKRGLLAGQQYLLSHGVTAWQDAWVSPELHAAYLALVDEGRLIASVRGALWWERDRGDEQIETLVAARSQGRGTYQPAAVKLMLDGVFENFTAAMLEPYLDKEGHPTSQHGIDLIEPERLPEIVTQLDAAGFSCHFHALGDRAVRGALDAIEAARTRNGPGPGRHQLAHLQLVHPHDLARFRQLGAIANVQPLWACNEPSMIELTIPFLTPDRVRLQYPFGDLLREGATLAMGSDWPVSTADVMQQISVAVHRTVPGEDTLAFLPEQRVTLVDALVAFTAGSAFANHLEAARGTIRRGAVADLVVLDADPFSVAEERLWSVSVDLTVVGGEVVHGDEP